MGKPWYKALEEELDRQYTPSRYDAVMAQAKRVLDAMTPAQKAKMYESQRVDWVYGQTKFRHPYFTLDDAQGAADAVDHVVRSDT